MNELRDQKGAGSVQFGQDYNRFLKLYMVKQLKNARYNKPKRSRDDQIGIELDELWKT